MKLIPFLTCKVIMTNPKQSDLTGKEELSWHDCVIKPDDIVAIRRCADPGYEDYAVIHFGPEEYFIVDLNYDKVILWWSGGAVTEKFIEDFNNIFGR